MTEALPAITLQPLAGPEVGVFTFRDDGPATIGRGAASDLTLLDPSVSRRHLTLVRRRGEWFATDEGSSGGTFLNGVKIVSATPVPLATGDLMRLGPWVFRVVVGDSPTRATSTIDDSTSTLRVERAGAARGGSERRLRLLSDGIARLNGAPDEESAARAVLDSALQGSGYARGAMLRRVQGDGSAPGLGAQVEIVATVRGDPADTGEFTLSKSLIEQADAGETVVLTGQQTSGWKYGQSLTDLEIHSALCVPVGLGGSVTGYMYLDARGAEQKVRLDAAGFCESLATAYGLAIANLRRAELERRQAELHAELAAAREVQQLVMPAPEGVLGEVEYAMRSLPGSFVAGDLFDVVRVPGGRVAVCIGDVSGHGAGAAMLMASAQAYLNGELCRLPPGADPADAVRALNQYLAARPLRGMFLSLWVGLIEPDGVVRYVDAGHGHWLLVSAEGVVVGRPTPLGQPLRDGGPPVGVDDAAEYASGGFVLGVGERLVVYSDGIIEQRGADAEPFGVVRLHAALRPGGMPRGDVAHLFSALSAFLLSPVLDDDATVASFMRRGGAERL